MSRNISRKAGIRVTRKNKKYFISRHAQSVANSMNIDALISFAIDTIEKSFSKLSNKKIEYIIKEYNPEILENYDETCEN